MKHVLVPADKATHSILLFVGYTILTLESRNLTVPRRLTKRLLLTVVNIHSDDLPDKCAVNVKERQDKLPAMYWLPKLHKRPY